MKAYEVTSAGWPRSRRIIAAKSHGQAKQGDYLASRDAGYEIPYTDFRARLAPDYDRIAERYTGCLGPITIGWENRESRERWGCLSADGTLERY